MATLEDIVAATKILSEDPESIMGVSGSKPKQNRRRASSNVKNDDGGSASDSVVETETVVESSFDEEKEKTGGESLSRVTYSSSSFRVNGTDDGMPVNDSWDESGKKNETGEDSLAKNGEGGKSTGYKQVNGSKRDDLYVDVNGDGGRGIGEKMDQNSGFRVGDFVWGKIRSHPWWPGQIYNPKDASEFAMKRKQEGRLLVAFFGDGSCSWCSPSQLTPFVENFPEMSTDSSSKSFLNAVQNAVDEVGRLVELEMSCNCVREKKKDVLAKPVVVNAALRGGVVMPEVDFRRLSIPEYKPAEVLEKVEQLAKAVSVSNALDLGVLRSWLSAFYYLKGGYVLPEYHEPFDIEGLEDKNKNVNEVANDFSVPIEVPILRPQDDDWLASPIVASVNSQGPSENKVLHKRKQKSVAELMGENTKIKPESRKRASVKEGTDPEKSASSKKRKRNDDGKLEGVGGEQASSTGKIGRKRKVEVSESPKMANVKDVNTETGGLGGADGGGRLLRKPKEIEVANAENTSGEAKEELEIVTTPRERKKSRYLSPPYTNLASRTGNSSFRTGSEVEHDKTAKIAQGGEHQKEATGDDLASQPISKSVDTSEEKLPEGRLERLNESDDTSRHTVEKDKKLSFSVSDVDTPVNELLSDIQLAAPDPFYLSKKGSLDMVLAFSSALRSSTYLQGQDYRADWNPKSLPSQVATQEKELSHKKAKLSDESSSKSLKNKRKSDTPKSKKTAETSVAKSTMEMGEGQTLARLILAFDRGFPLPSKKDIMRLYGKFGSLNKKETKVDTDSHSIWIVYMNDSDAEAAFKSSLSQCPFGSENVSYRLQHSSAGSKSRRSNPKVSSPLKQAPEKREASHPTDDLVSDINVIRQKLEITAAIVENYHKKFSSPDKSSLKDEMKRLTENVETVSEKVRIMAEKTSSK